MSWYQYTGNVVRSIATGYGEVVAVEPYGRVEIHRMSMVVENMVRQRVLRPCGPPAQIAPYATKAVGGGALLEPSEFAGYFVDRGATRSAAQPPSKAGLVERTAIEREVLAAADASKNVSPAEASGSVEEAADPAATADAVPTEEGQPTDALDEGAPRRRRR